jgi:hypothetical protein
MKDTSNHNSGFIILPAQPMSQSSLASYMEELNNLCVDGDVPVVPGG